MDNTTREKIKEILKKLITHEISIHEALKLIAEAKEEGGVSTQDSGPPVGGGSGGGPGGNNP